MSAHEGVRLEVHSAIARVTLDRPESLNSLTEPMLDALGLALDRVAADPAVRVVMLTGAGRAFCAGAYLAPSRVAEGGAPPDLGELLLRHYAPVVERLTRIEKPVVCAVNGIAAGAGMSLVLACDIAIAAKSASFVQAFVGIGLLPDAGATYFLPRAVGHARAMALMMTAEPTSAAEAARMGLIWCAVDDEALEGEVRAMADRLAAAPAGALAAIKRALHASADNDLRTQIALEADEQRRLGRSADFREGVSAFVEKRPPRFGVG